MSLPEEQQRVIAAAIAAAGPMGSQWEWEQRVIAALPIVATMLSDEQSLIAKRTKMFADAHVYTGLFVSLRLEESSKRAILRTDPQKTKDGVPQFDEIRTDRIDGYGQRTYQTLRKCKPGDELLCWRVNEPMRTDPMKNVRVLYHVKVLRQAQKPGDAGAQTPSAGRAVTRPAAPPTPPEESQPQVGSAPPPSLISDFPKYSNKQKLAIANRCRDGGIQDFLNPTPEQLDKVLLVITEELFTSEEG